MVDVTRVIVGASAEPPVGELVRGIDFFFSLDRYGLPGGEVEEEIIRLLLRGADQGVITHDLARLRDQRRARRNFCFPFLVRHGRPQLARRAGAGDHAVLHSAHRGVRIPRSCGVLLGVDIDKGVPYNNLPLPDVEPVRFINPELLLPELLGRPVPQTEHRDGGGTIAVHHADELIFHDLDGAHPAGAGRSVQAPHLLGPVQPGARPAIARVRGAPVAPIAQHPDGETASGGQDERRHQRDHEDCPSLPPCGRRTAASGGVTAVGRGHDAVTGRQPVTRRILAAGGGVPLRRE